MYLWGKGLNILKCTRFNPNKHINIRFFIYWPKNSFADDSYSLQFSYAAFKHGSYWVSEYYSVEYWILFWCCYVSSKHFISFYLYKNDLLTGSYRFFSHRLCFGRPESRLKSMSGFAMGFWQDRFRRRALAHRRLCLDYDVTVSDSTRRPNIG